MTRLNISNMYLEWWDTGYFSAPRWKWWLAKLLGEKSCFGGVTYYMWRGRMYVTEIENDTA
jgi:hypothetical protein